MDNSGSALNLVMKAMIADFLSDYDDKDEEIGNIARQHMRREKRLLAEQKWDGK